MPLFSKKNTFTSIVMTTLVGTLLVFGIIWFTYYGPFAKNSETTSSNSKTLDGQISKFSDAIKSNPGYIQNYISLSQAYLQKVRETADISYYEKINELMDKAEKIDPKNSDVPATRASVEIGRHHFKEGKIYAEKAISLNVDNHLYYGLLGDADIELGKYDEAVEAFQKMVDLRPDYPSYIRIAYIRELFGDIPGAKKFLQLSIETGSSFKENIAFAYVELGKLEMREDLKKAEIDFNSALKIINDYPPALEGLGKVAFFNKDNEKARDYFNQAINKLPIAQYAVDLADIDLTEGKTVEAKQNETIAQLTFDKSAVSGVNVDLEESLFLSDHDLTLDKAEEGAKRAYIERPSIYAADYLGWALYKNGKSNEAAKYTKEALRLGETDPLILFHQGMIAAKNGNKINAKKYLSEALRINPYFSILDVGIAQKTLNDIK